MARRLYALGALLALLSLSILAFYLIPGSGSTQESLSNFPKREAVSLEEFSSLCPKTPEDVKKKCFVDYFKGRVSAIGVGSSIKEMHDFALQDESFSIACHAVSHALGQSMYSEESVVSLVQMDDDSCPVPGFRHGLLQELSQAGTDFFEKTYPTVCLGIKDSVEELDCIHGIGHSIALHHKKEISTVVGHCGIFQNKEHMDTCVSSVIMSYSEPDGTTFVADGSIKVQTVEQDDLSTVCTRFPNDMKNVCWGSVSSFFDRTMSIDEIFAKGAEICAKAEDFVLECASSIGTTSINWQSSNLSNSKELIPLFNKQRESCSIFKEAASSCVDGAVQMVQLLWTAMGEGDLPSDICNYVPSYNTTIEGCLWSKKGS
jgi:hypothetical protein